MMPSLLQSRRARIVAIVAAVSLLLGWCLTAYPRGMLMAYLDHARGDHEVQTWGLPVQWEGEYGRLLNERYGVRLHYVGDCMASLWAVGYTDGYNKVSRRLLIEKYGLDIFKECAEEAEQRWEDENL